MIISYAGFSEMRMRDIDKALGREAKMIVFFLFTSYDDLAQKQLKDLAKDLDALTGKQCAAIIFAPPDPSRRLRASALECYLNPEQEDQLWRRVNAELTKNTYEIASKFEIPFERLPAMLFVSRESESYAYLSLRNKDILGIHRKTREIFSRWYSDNKDEFDFNKNTWRKFIMEELILAYKAKMRDLSIEEDTFAKVVKFVKRISDHPREMRPLEEILKKHDISIEIDGAKISHSSIRNQLEEIVNRRLSLMTAPQVHFPIEIIEQIDREVKIEHFYDVAKKLRDETSDWITKLLPFIKGTAKRAD